MLLQANICDRFSCTFYLITAKFALKPLLTHLDIPFLTMNFSKQNCVGCKLSNVALWSCTIEPERKERKNDIASS